MRQVVESPIGPLTVETNADTVIGVRFAGPDGAAFALGAAHAQGGARDSGAAPASGTAPGTGCAAVSQLAGYFAGTLTEFTVPVLIVRGSEFERAVWAELCRIPYGEMRTYGDVARAVGDLGAARAVGTACNRNPVPVIVPCHRVVGAGGKLVGFGGGLPRKRHLLELEARVALQRAWS